MSTPSPLQINQMSPDCQIVLRRIQEIRETAAFMVLNHWPAEAYLIQALREIA